MDDEEKLNLTSPLFIMAIVSCLMGDFSFFLILGIIIPVAGIFIALFALFIRFILGVLAAALILPKLKHFVPKLIFILAVVVPLPIMTILLFVAVAAQNRLVEIVIEQLAIQAIAVATAGAGEVLEVAAIPAEGAELAVGAAEIAGAAGTAAAEVGVEATAAGAEAAGGVEAAVGAEAAGEAAPLTRAPLVEQPVVEGGIAETPELPTEEAPKKISVEEEQEKRIEEHKKKIEEQWKRIKEQMEGREEKKEEEDEDDDDDNEEGDDISRAA